MVGEFTQDDKVVTARFWSELGRQESEASSLI